MAIALRPQICDVTLPYVLNSKAVKIDYSKHKRNAFLKFLAGVIFDFEFHCKTFCKELNKIK